MMIISDTHKGITNAMNAVCPDVFWQRCQFHLSKNTSDKTLKKYQSEIRSELQEMFNCRTLKEARTKYSQITADDLAVA